MLLSILQCIGQSPKQSIIQPTVLTGPGRETCFRGVFLLTELEFSLKSKCRGLKIKFGKNVNIKEHLNPYLMLISLESSEGLIYSLSWRRRLCSEGSLFLLL